MAYSIAQEFFAHKRVLVAGGLGFIGSHLTRRLVQCGAHVTVVDNLARDCGGRLENIADVRHRLVLNLSDMSNAQTLSYLVRDQAVVFSVAGQTSHINSMRQPIHDLEINCGAQLSLLECIRQHNSQAKLVHASTRQIYGRPQYLPVDENHPLAPTDINGIHKLAAENYYSLYGRLYGLHSVVLRLTNTYGPNMNVGPGQGFTSVFIDQALRGETIQVFGDGTQQRDFNYVGDVVDAMLLCAATTFEGHHVYNLGHDERFSLIEFLETLHAHVPLKYELIPFPHDRRGIDIGDYYADYAALRGFCGWQPHISLNEGLGRTIRSYARRDFLPGTAFESVA